jgi:hypothetical protein
VKNPVRNRKVSISFVLSVAVKNINIFYICLKAINPFISLLAIFYGIRNFSRKNQNKAILHEEQSGKLIFFISQNNTFILIQTNISLISIVAYKEKKLFP